MDSTLVALSASGGFTCDTVHSPHMQEAFLGFSFHFHSRHFLENGLDTS